MVHLVVVSCCLNSLLVLQIGFAVEDAPDAPVSMALVSEPAMALHDMGSGHPESAQRLVWIEEGIRHLGLDQQLQRIAAPRATDEQLSRVHTEQHVARWSVQPGQSPAEQNTIRAARFAAGAAVAAVDQVMTGQAHRAFSLVRPPGHHASQEIAEGFCFFNNVAVAARYAQDQYEVERVLILDWDVHAGNGTYAIFQDDPTVFDVHIHQDPATIYPGTGFAHERGTGVGAGFSANFPLAPGSSGQAVQSVMRQEVGQIVRSFRPQLIIISAGFDMHEADPLGSFRVSTQDFVAFTQIMIELAEEVADGRLVSVLEGGYSRAAMFEAVPHHIQTMLQYPRNASLSPDKPR